MRLLLVSEGPSDVGRGDGSATDRRGALLVLVRRTLEERLGRSLADSDIEADYLPRVHALSDSVTGFARKVKLAITEAAIRKCTHLAVVVDRDRTVGATRLTELRRGVALAEAEERPLAYKTAVGVAIETIEAWLLADETALNQALAPMPPATTQSCPEDLRGAPGTATHPKVVFRGIVGRSTREGVDAYGDVAAFVRLSVLRQRCPNGFGHFATELDRIAK